VSVARRVRPEPARDLFDPPITWTPPKEFADLLAERAKVKTAPLEVVPPPVVPAWAAEAATPQPPPARPRDFAADEEHVRCAAGLVVRLRTSAGHLYRAYERADVFSYGVHLAGDVAWGRIDTRRPVVTPGPEDMRDYQRACEAEAVAAILAACIETVSLGEPPSCGVFPSPGGYVLVIVDPEPRYRAARERGKR